MPSVARWLLPLSACFSGWFIACFFFIALLSIGYPYQLEWMEGQVMDVVARVMSDQSIYVEPSLEYTPFIYAPLYFYVTAFMSSLVGLDFFAGRLVSLLSITGVGLILFHWVRKEAGGWSTAWLAVGLFFATYQLSSRWFDVARIDSLYLFLLAAACFTFFYSQRAWCSVAAGLLFSLAFFTKQNTLIAVLPLLVAALYYRPRPSLITIFTFVIVTGVTIIAYNEATDGWFNFYMFHLPAAHRIEPRYIWGFWAGDLFKPLWPLILISLIGWGSIFCRDRKKAWLYLALAAGLVAAAYAGRLHRYGWTNVLLPAHFILALAGALAISHWHQHGEHKKLLAGLALVLIQLGLLFYNPMPEIPSKEAREQGDEFVKKLAMIEGEIFMPEIQFISTKAGKQSYGYGLAAIDVLQSDITERKYVKHVLRYDLQHALRDQRFGAIITSGLIRLNGLNDHYHEADRIAYPKRMLSGYQSRRSFKIYLPIDKDG